MTADQTTLAEAYRRYREGDLKGADELGRTLLPAHADDPTLTGLLGMVAVQTGRMDAAVPHLQHALRFEPLSLQLRTGLAFALANSNRLDEARAVARVSDAPQLQRIVAFADQQQGRTDAAIEGYRRVVSGFPEDVESWGNLGALLLNRGDIGEAMTALSRAMQLRPEPHQFVNMSKALAVGERHQERQALLRSAAERFPGDPSLLVELGLAEGAAGDNDAAADAYRQAIAADPSNPSACLEFGMLLEKLNRLDELKSLIDQARSRGLSGAEIDFIEAWLLRRTGRFGEALELAQKSGGAINPSRHAQLMGEVYDRLGQTDEAFAAFTEMNRISAETPAAEHARQMDLPGTIASAIQRMEMEDPSAWDTAKAGPKTPIFIVGFPRSGTTLIDTLLMNVPQFRVMEEVSIIERLEPEVGTEPLDRLTDEQLDRLRLRYFELAAELDGPGEGRRIVDKFPLNMTRLPLIARLFPGAPIIFVERHPADVVLSCFMARFQINRANVQFHRLEDAARLYDLAMQAFTAAEQRLPLNLHRVRYERMVADPEKEMRGLIEFLGVSWSDDILDNRSAAARRAHIATASYAQVGEELYTRAAGRWVSYARHLEPVMPVLQPWIARLGYDN